MRPLKKGKSSVMPKPKITSQKNLKIFFATASLVIISILLLIFSTPAVNLAESKISYASNESQQVPQFLENKILGEVKKPKIEIVDGKNQAPFFSAGGVLSEDLDINYIFFEKNMNTRLSPASTTKIMTAIVAIEHFDNGDILVVPTGAVIGGSSMGLNLGEQLTFRSLLYGMLLNSGNDAAYTIALNYPGGMYEFVEAMNAKALELGLKNTHFENPAGFDSPNHYSSAYDLSVIAKEAIKNPQLSKIFSTKETSVVSYDKTKAHALKNLNKLLGEDGVIGIKTGYTEQAGENLVGLVERNGHRVLTVVLSSSDRFGETKNLMDWIYSNFTWKVN